MMARNWKEVRAEAAPYLNESNIAEIQETLRGEILATELAEVRRSHQVTQMAVADAMGVAQPRVSAIEHGNVTKTEVGTLEAYVRALGGRLRIIADFDDRSVLVHG
jgi:predicted XRE-type DNA-binding protein